MVHLPSTAQLDLNFGFAWVAFALAIAAHAADEARHGFLAVYNPNALAIRRRLHVPVPVFTIRGFVAALSSAVFLLLLLAPLAFDGIRWVRIAALPLAIVAGLFNAFLHIAGSVFYRRPMAGVLTSPLLVATGIWLLSTCRPH
jgi:hypothetical protein